MVQRLQQFYQEKVVPQLMEQFKYKNKHQVPTLEKIVINREYLVMLLKTQSFWNHVPKN